MRIYEEAIVMSWKICKTVFYVAALVFMLFCGVRLIWISAKPVGPRIACDQPSASFGAVLANQFIHHTFTLTNTGDQDLVITDVKPGCGCTTTDIVHGIIPPHSKLDLSVEVNTSGKHGAQRMVILVSTNESKRSEFLLDLHGNVESPIAQSK
jgi:hypothetical protein